VATQYAPPLSSSVGIQARRAPPSRRNVAVLSHAEYVPTLTAASALRVQASLTLTLKVVSESRVTWATSVPFLFFGLPRPLFSTKA